MVQPKHMNQTVYKIRGVVYFHVKRQIRSEVVNSVCLSVALSIYSQAVRMRADIDIFLKILMSGESERCCI